MLAIKIALSRYTEFTKKTGVKLYPIIGSASLPFRGGLTPETVADFCHEYREVKTALLQSSFRYDHDKAKVLDAIKKLEETLPASQAVSIPSSEEKKLKQLIPTFEKFYRRTIERISPLINQVAAELPKRRERVQHIGLFGYSRSIGEIKLPRAIGFTGALYSLGIPPEIIGTGRGIKYARETREEALLEKYYVGLKRELKRAGRFLCKDKLVSLANKSEIWQEILEDIHQIESYLGEELGPVTSEELEHAKIVKELHKKLSANESFAELLPALAILRKSLG